METGKRLKNKKMRLSVIVKTFFIVVILSLIASFFVYLSSDSSKVRSVRVINNSFVSDDYIREICDIDTDTHYLFLMTSFVENKAEKDPLIKAIEIEICDHNSVVIRVEENSIVGYSASGTNEETTVKLWLYDGSSLVFENKYIKNVALLPLLDFADEEKTKEVAVQLGKVDPDILSRISQISSAAFTYEADMLKCAMDDGYYVYASISDLAHLNYYLKIVESDRSQSARCIWFMEDYSSAAIVECSEIEN